VSNQDETAEITVLLQRVNGGDRSAREELASRLQSELRRLAASYLRRNRPDHTLQPTALVIEAYLKMFGASPVEWQDRAHFFAVAARAMRQILVDHARAKQAEKRGGGVPLVHLEEDQLLDRGRPAEILALDEAMHLLKSKDDRTHAVVELRFFGGLSVEETAEAMEISPRTVKREWGIGRAWLRRQLQSGMNDGSQMAAR
jgi:RNA polymerase sigma factor (TIGR02999 family)